MVLLDSVQLEVALGLEPMTQKNQILCSCSARWAERHVLCICHFCCVTYESAIGRPVYWWSKDVSKDTNMRLVCHYIEAPRAWCAPANDGWRAGISNVWLFKIPMLDIHVFLTF